MKTYTAFIAGLVFASISATVAADTVESDFAETIAPLAQLVIYRPHSQGRTGYLNYRVSLDGERIGRLKAGTFYLLELSPGEHSIKSSDRGASAIEFTVGESDTLILQGEVDAGHAIRWTEVDSAQAIEAAPFLADALPEIESGDYTLWATIEH